MPNRHRVILPSLVALLATHLYAGSAAASGDCEGESGRAHGMCQAYCEALDCDADPEAKGEACGVLESHFTSLTGRSLPCEAVFEPPDVDCPCLEFYGWSGAFEPNVEGLSCWYGTFTSSKQTTASTWWARASCCASDTDSVRRERVSRCKVGSRARASAFTSITSRGARCVTVPSARPSGAMPCTAPPRAAIRSAGTPALHPRRI